MAKYEPANWENQFLTLYSKTGNILLSAEGCGINRNTVYKRRKAYRTFAERMDECRKDAVERLEAVARARAIQQSDTLLIFLLKSLKPEVYREQRSIKIEGLDELLRLTNKLGISAADVVQEMLNELSSIDADSE